MEEVIVYKWNDKSSKYLGLSLISLTTVIVMIYLIIAIGDNTLVEGFDIIIGFIAIFTIIYHFCSFVYCLNSAFDSITKIKVKGEKVHIPKLKGGKN
jgi:hypothetical protein